MRCFGLFKITFFRHVGVLSGVGVGGGSLVYANTLPVPKQSFFTSPSWAHLADWETELKPFYPIALRMLGAATNPRLETGDLALRELGREIGMEQHFEPTEVSVYLRQTRRNRARSVLRRQGARAHRLHFLRRLHDRLPPQREEFARQELSLPRRAARRANPARVARDRRARARRRGRRRRLCGRLAAERDAQRRGRHAALPRRGVRGRRARHGRSAARAQANHAAAPVGPDRLRRAHQLRGADPGDRARSQQSVLRRRRHRLDPAHRRALASRTGALQRGLGLLAPHHGAARRITATVSCASPSCSPTTCCTRS